MTKFLKDINNAILLAILAIAAVLRFYHFDQLPFMHDEFSALFRTQYDGFAALLEFAIKPDAHPAGVQSFLFYWVGWFGFSEFWVKLPFALMGLASVLLIYLIGKRWFNPSTALFAALMLAISQYAIFHSQLARPYAPALFFGLLSTLFWTRIVFDKKAKGSDYFWFVVASISVAYIHAFSLLLLLTQALTGLFIVRGKRMRNYLFTGLIIFIFYLPYLRIFIQQMQYGGVGGWLAAPKASFFIDYFSYVFHYSVLFFAVVIAAVLSLSIWKPNVQKGQGQFRVIALLWVLFITLTAYFYSIYRTPILQFSSLYFVYPFILLLLFSFIRDLSQKWKVALLTLVALVGIYSLVVDRQHYRIMYQQGYDQIALNYHKDNQEYAGKRMVFILHTPNHKMLDHYFKRWGELPDYFVINDTVSYISLEEYLLDKKAEVVVYAMTDYMPLSPLESLKDGFPYVLKTKSFFNASYQVLAKEPMLSVSRRKDHSRTMLKTLAPDKDVYLYESVTAGYSPSLNIAWDSIVLGPNDVLHISADFSASGNQENSILVLSIDDAEGNNIFWQGEALSNHIQWDSSSHASVYVSKRSAVFEEIAAHSSLKIYVWKQDSLPLKLASLSLFKTTQHPFHMGLFQKIVENP